jgi:hypothetical protein
MAPIVRPEAAPAEAGAASGSPAAAA